MVSCLVSGLSGFKDCVMSSSQWYRWTEYPEHKRHIKESTFLHNRHSVEKDLKIPRSPLLIILKECVHAHTQTHARGKHLVRGREKYGHTAALFNLHNRNHTEKNIPQEKKVSYKHQFINVQGIHTRHEKTSSQPPSRTWEDFLLMPRTLSCY